jgi:hypothetical protein
MRLTNLIRAEQVYRVTVGVAVGDGYLQLQIPASATVADSAGNTVSKLPFTSFESYMIDRISPTVSIIIWSAN